MPCCNNSVSLQKIIPPPYKANVDYQIVAANDLLIISNFYPREIVIMINLMDKTLVMTMNERVRVEKGYQIVAF